jgi:hypothetical protein
MFCVAPVIFSGTRFGPHFDYSCIKGGTKFGSHFWLPFSFFSHSTFIKKRMQNEFSQPDYCRTLLYQSTFMHALGGLPHCDWLRHRRGCLDQCGRNTYTVSCGRTSRLETTTPYKNSEIKRLRKHRCIHISSDTNGWAGSKIFRITWTCYGTQSHLNIHPELCL